ncbi:uncharacterized protein LOC120632143 [Pararge aegeria]|uniref:uncharacterized protein LOC120632143 n=1 Tax=Pararge aegeria TaxID=116150 RepID=UPI0019D27FBD|nr:uncharacterized protein LOC120632143 [Pararge aegeria]
MPSAGAGRERYWAQCVAECRRRAVQALCRCSPYTKPADNPRAVCSLEHMACLDKHKEKLSFFYPGEHADESLSQEQSDSVECLHCRPDCARLLYAATLSTVPYGPFVKKAFYNHFAYGLKLENGTVIRIYFNTKSQQLYLVESNLRVYEVIAFMSSQWVFVLGMTLISVMEFVYHCTIRWHHHYKRRWRRDRNLPKCMDFWGENDFYGQ